MLAEKLKLLDHLFHKAEWTHMYESNNIDFDSTQMEGSDFYCIKTTGFLNVSAERAAEYYWDLYNDKSKIFNIDNTISEFKILVSPNENLRVCYQVNSLPWPLSPRDLIYIQHKISNEMGNVVLMFSYPDYEKDQNPDYVRSDLTISAVIFEPRGDKCKIIKIAHLDPKGSIPSFVVNTFTDKVADIIRHMKQTFP